jgi:hypothetical protein
MRTDRNHGSPYDRGSADSWYGRKPNPHYYKGDSYNSELVLADDMKEEELCAYWQGYDDNEADPDARKVY